MSLRPNGVRNLFITYKKLCKVTSTLSKQKKITIRETGVDTSIFSAHGTGQASTSATLKNCVIIEVIRKVTCWIDQSSVFAKHYSLLMVKENESRKSF